MSEQGQKELLPCPFCGRAANCKHHTTNGGSSYWSASCPHCCVGFQHFDKPVAVTQWNERASLSREAALVEAGTALFDHFFPANVQAGFTGGDVAQLKAFKAALAQAQERTSMGAKS